MEQTQMNEIGKDALDAHFELLRNELADEHRDDDACLALWRTVIERAVSDLQYLQKLEGRKNLKKHEEEKLRRIRENPPHDFFHGPWFELICEYLQVNPERVRRGIDDLLERRAA